jgi:hypothetical protein
MRQRPAVLVCLGLGVVFSGLWGACGNPPAAPGGPSESGGSQGSVVKLEIVGPATIAPGHSAQYSALRVLLDGSRVPATGVAWSAGPSVLLRVNATGLVTAEPQFRSEGTVQAELTGNRSIRASREILVLPDGTFRVVGTVMEADAANIPVQGARAEVATDESFSTLAAFATSGPDGRYKLYGVPGDGYFRVRREGYVTRTDRIQIANHETRNVQLRLESARPALAGDYRMTIEGPGSCPEREPLPPDLRRRQYDAVITQNGPQLTVTLTGAPFLISGDQGNRFTGVVTGTSATFKMRRFSEAYYYPVGPPHPDVVERLQDGTLLMVTGDATVSATSGGLSGSMFGGLTQWRGTAFPNVIFLGYCGADRLTLERR